MKYSSTLLLLLCAIVTSLHAQDTSKLQQIVLGKGRAIEKCIASQQLGKYYDYKDPDNGIKWMEIGLPFARECDNDSLLWTHYDLLADLYDYAHNLDPCINYMQLSLALKEKAGNLRQIAITLTSFGVVYGERAEHLKQTECYVRALKIMEQLGDSIEALSLSASLAGVYGSQGNYSESIKAYHVLIPQFIRHKMYNTLRITYGRIGVYYCNLNSFDSTLFYSALEIASARTINDAEWCFEAWQRRAYYCSNFEKYKDYKIALDSMMNYAVKLNNKALWGNYYGSQALYNIKVTRNYKLALAYYYKSFAISNEIDRKAAIGNLKDIATTYELLGDYKNAYKAMQRAYSLKDSVVTDAGQEKIAEMQTKYQTEKKEAQIKILDKENKLRQRTSYFLITGLGLLVLVGFSLYRNNRIKQKSNQKLTTLNTALDAANQSKAKLFSILSHDLRSPVSDLFSYLQLQKLAPHLLTEEKKQAKQDLLYTSTDHLLNTMEDLLLWSKSQMESFTPDKTNISLQSLIKSVTDIYQQAIAEKQIHLALPEDDLNINTDENMLKTILRNLVNNAAKFTPDGGSIEIKIEKEIPALQVFNSGQPLDKITAGNLFQWSDLNSNQSGYGLKLSKELADKLSLTIEAVPQVNGNKFTIGFL